MAKKTVVVKIGTSSLTEKSGRLDVARLRALTQQVANLRDAGMSVIMVTSAAIAPCIGGVLATNSTSASFALQP